MSTMIRNVVDGREPTGPESEIARNTLYRRTEARVGSGVEATGDGRVAIPDYGFRTAEVSYTHAYVWPVVEGLLRERVPASRRVMDFGCGNGGAAGALRRLGYDVIGVDASRSGIEVARGAHPGCRFEVASVYDDLAAEFGQFPLVVSLEVIEHLYSPKRFGETLWDLLEPGGVGVISTPFHGYWKNLALALTNAFDAHFSPQWEGGHIKFWSERTLGAFLARQGFVDLKFIRAGRIPPLAKSMVVSFRRPLREIE